MKKKIRECSKNELIDYFSQNLTMTMCDVERVVDTLFYLRSFGFMNKPLVNSKFLDIEIDIPEPHILDKEEHDYLRSFLKPYKDVSIEKLNFLSEEFLSIKIGDERIELPNFKTNSMYKGMELNKTYTIEDLELDKEWNND